jgi:hypothetical protein
MDVLAAILVPCAAPLLLLPSSRLLHAGRYWTATLRDSV